MDKGGKIGTILMGLSKALDTINYSLLLVKLGAYGFSRTLSNLSKTTFATGSKEVL